MRKSSTLQRARRARAGFTLAELLVALMVFSVGALALVATSANVITLMTSGKTRNVAADVAEAKFELMRSQPCASHTADSIVNRGVTVVTSLVNLTRADDVTVRVKFIGTGHRQQTKIYRTFLPC